MQCHTVGVNIPYRPLNYNKVWAMKLLVVGVICLVWNLELASRRVAGLGGVARYVRCGWLIKWLAALPCVSSFISIPDW
jgi:hypothetical protein